MTAPARSRALDAAVIVGACSALALAAWLAPASIRIVQWPAGGPVRLALLLPFRDLALWLVAALLAGGALCWFYASWRNRARGDGGLRPLARRLAPLLVLAVWGIPYLPWIPDRLPLLLVLAGPLKWVVAGGVLLRVTGADRALARGVDRGAGIPRAAVLLVSFVLYAVVGVYAARSLGAGGDEPHYLVITESLLKDGDLKIENNHARRDYLPFFRGNLRPDFFERGKDGEIYSIHAPGLPALVLPAYWLAGHAGVVVFIAALAALTALAIFDLAAAIAGRTAGVVAWIASSLTVPVIPYAWMVFPEMPGACIVAWAALWVQRPGSPSALGWFARGTVLALLPWLHTKFIIFLAIFAAAIGWRLLRRRRALVSFALPVSVSVAAWFYSFYAIYGSFNPEAPYGAYTALYVLTKFIPHGLLGLFFDQKFGLLPYSPIYLTVPVGAWWLWRRSDTRFLVVVLAAATGAFVLSTARLYMFWGGSSAPARFLVPVIPCLAPMVAIVVVQASGTLPRAINTLWLAISLAMGAVGLLWPTRLVLFSVDHGRARILELLQGGSPLSYVVPTFTEPDWTTNLGPFAAWLAVSLAALWMARLTARKTGSGWRSIGVAAAVFLLLGAVVTSPSPAARTAVARGGALDTIWRVDGERFRTLDYQTLARTTPERLVELTTLDLTTTPREGSDIVADVVALPAGEYELTIAMATSVSPVGELRLSDPPRAEFVHLAALPVPPVRVPFSLPLAPRRLTVSLTDPSAGAAVTQVRIAPRAIVPPEEREDTPVRMIESIPGAPFAAYLGYTDEHAYAEQGSFWSRGTARTKVFLAPGGASRLLATLSTGPRNGTVSVSVGSAVQTVVMEGGRDTTVSFPLEPGVRLVPLTVQSSTMFRPSDVDPRSDDGRGLGCQMRIQLE